MRLTEREKIERDFFLQVCRDRIATHSTIHSACSADHSFSADHSLERDIYLWKWQSAPRAVIIDQDIANIIWGTK